LRTVISIADRMPEPGKRFYETGPAYGIARVARYLEDQVAAGVLAIEDCELSAAVDDLQATDVQCRWPAHREAYGLRGEKGGEDVSCRLPALEDQARFFSLSI
jgi:hypothetical protein